MSVGLTARLLGEFRLDGIDLRELRSRKARQLLKRLALESGAPVHPDRLVLDLWEDDPPADPAGDLAVLASRARKVVGTDNLVRSDGGYALKADRCDRDEVIALVQEASARLREGDPEAARTRAEAALGLVPGRLLADEPDASWARAARATMDERVAFARQLAAQAAYLTGRLDDAVNHANAALEAGPYDEVSLRWLMRAHHAAGRAGEALVAYARMQARLREDLGSDPDPETVRLHGAVLTGGRDDEGVPTVERGPVLVGRDGEYAALDDALTRSRNGAMVVLVTGEPGIGKSQLARAWAARARDRGAVVLSARVEAGAGLQPLADVVAAAATEPALDADASLVRQIFGPTGQDPTVGWADLPGPGARVETVRHRLYGAMARLLDRVASPVGVAVILDDLDAADETVRGWFEYVGDHRAEHRFVALGLWRGVGTPPVPATLRIEVPPLDEEAVAALVGADRARALWERSGGNPLLLSELAAADDDSVPLSLRDLVARRLDDAAAAAPTLRTAATLSSDIDLDLLARVVERSPSEVLDHLEQGIHLALLVEDQDRIRFRHEILREAIEAGTTVARRSWIHGRAAELLAERPDANPVELARHARLGGNTRLVARGLLEAAELARRRFDLTGAEALLGEALDAEVNGESLIRRSRVRMARGDFVGADEDAVAALGAGAGGDALELRAWAARNRHDMDAAIRLGRAGADLASDPGQKASCLLAVAFAHRGTGDLRAADRVLEEALEVPEVPAGVAAWSGVLRTHQGRPREALATLEPLLGADAGGLHSFWVEHMLQMTAHAFGMVGRAADALSALDRLDRELERRGSDARYDGMPDAYRSWVLRNLGVPEAVDLARSTAERAQLLEINAQSHLDLADSLLMAGRVADAVEVFEATAPLLEDPALSNRWRCQQRSGILAARLHFVAGDAREALTRAGEVADAASGRGDVRYGTIARLMLARAQARLGQAIDEEQVHADLDRLAEVAAIEAWWLAADVAADTGLDHGMTVARSTAALLREHAGEHRARFERVAARVLT